MQKPGKKVEDVKLSNRSLLLNLLYYKGPMSRKALADKANLTAAAITTLAGELIAEGSVVETEKKAPEGKLGRSEQLLDINYDNLYVIGIRFETEIVEINLVSLDSKVLTTDNIRTSSYNTNILFKSIAVTIENMLRRFEISIETVVGIGVTVRGIVDSESGISINSYGVLPEDFNIRNAMGIYFNCPVTVENNVRSMLISDIILRHAEPMRNTLFIKYGPGVGGALLAGGDMYLGSSFHAVELGHVCVNVQAEKCVCGKRGCLETAVSYEAIIKKVEAVFSEGQARLLFDSCNGERSELTISKIFDAYEKGDRIVEDLIDDVIQCLAVSIVNFASLFDPEIVLLSSEAFIIKKFTNNLQSAILSCSGNLKPRYLIAANSKKLDKTGAASIAINHFLITGGQYLRQKIKLEEGNAQ